MSDDLRSHHKIKYERGKTKKKKNRSHTGRSTKSTVCNLQLNQLLKKEHSFDTNGLVDFNLQLLIYMKRQKKVCEMSFAAICVCVEAKY